MDAATPIPDPDPPDLQAGLALEAACQEAAAAERRCLAQTLHDTVAQSLTAIYFSVKRIEMQLAKDHAELSGKVASLGDMIRQASGELHACIQGLERVAPPSRCERPSAHSGSPPLLPHPPKTSKTKP